jgi:hypothetical protein
MTELMFFKGPVSLTVGEVATLTGATPRIGARLNDLITNVAPLNTAGASDLAFLSTAKYADGLSSTQAGACLMEERFESQAPIDLNVLLTKEPYRDFVVVARNLFQDALRPSSMFEANGIEPTAVVHSSAQIGVGVTIDPCAVIGPRASVGSGTVIGATAVIGPDVRVGRNCSIGHGASIIHAIIGDNVNFTTVFMPRFTQNGSLVFESSSLVSFCASSVSPESAPAFSLPSFSVPSLCAPSFSVSFSASVVRENTTFTEEYYAADKRYIGNAVQVFFRDGSSTERAHFDFPIGHRKRRAEGIPILKQKFEGSVAAHFSPPQTGKIAALFADRAKLEAMPVHEFVAGMVKN